MGPCIHPRFLDLPPCPVLGAPRGCLRGAGGPHAPHASCHRLQEEGDERCELVEADSRPSYHHGNGPYNDVDVPGCWFFKLPHKARRGLGAEPSPANGAASPCPVARLPPNVLLSLPISLIPSRRA